MATATAGMEEINLASRVPENVIDGWVKMRAYFGADRLSCRDSQL